MKRGIRVFLIVSVALTLSCTSLMYQRIGPTQITEGEGSGCPTANPCRMPMLGAGFPFAYLVDKPGISVVGAIHPIEDEFRPGAFILDFIFYLALCLLLSRLRRR